MISFFKRFFKQSNKDVEQALLRGAVIVDVRSRSEFERGHIAGSKNIALNEIKLKTELIRNWQKPVVTVCQSGSRSALAKKILYASGIEVYDGGAWALLNTNKTV